MWVKSKKEMLQVKGAQKYNASDRLHLGDTSHQNAKVTANLAARLAKDVASFSPPVIRAILENILLGTYRIQVGLEIRKALFVNSVLFNYKTWHSITDSDLT